MARMTAAKAALSIRHDALADADSKSAEDAPLIGIEARIKLESRLRRLEQSIGIQSNRKVTTSYQQLTALKMPNAGSYNPAADDVMIPAANVIDEDEDRSKKEKKMKKKKVLVEEMDVDPPVVVDEAVSFFCFLESFLDEIRWMERMMGGWAILFICFSLFYFGTGGQTIEERS